MESLRHLTSLTSLHLVLFRNQLGDAGAAKLGESLSYLTTLTFSPPETIRHLADLLRRLPEHGILSMVRFVFGLDTDDEGVFERTLRFCRQAKIGLPHFSVVTPLPDGLNSTWRNRLLIDVFGKSVRELRAIVKRPSLSGVSVVSA